MRWWQISSFRGKLEKILFGHRSVIISFVVRAGLFSVILDWSWHIACVYTLWGDVLFSSSRNSMLYIYAHGRGRFGDVNLKLKEKRIMHFSLTRINRRFGATSLFLFLLVSITISACSTPGGLLNSVEDRRAYTCNIIKVFYDYDFDGINKLLYNSRDPENFETNTIYDLRGEMEFMAEILVKNSGFECVADYKSQDEVIAHGTITQEWNHGIGYIEFYWIFHFGVTGEALLQEFEIQEIVKDYEPRKENPETHS